MSRNWTGRRVKTSAGEPEKGKYKEGEPDEE